MAAFIDLLGIYLVPFALALPVAVGLFWLTARRPDDEPAARPPAPPSSTSSAVPAVPAPPELARRALDAAAQRPAPAPGNPDAGVAPASGLPVAPLVVPPAPAAAPRVLVVDDSAVVRAKLKRLLEGAGYAVDLAHDGVQALERLQHDSHYALLITDLEMPQMDGFELIASVQGSLATEDLPIIAITGHEALSARVHDCQGLYGIFRKPWNDRELLKRVATVARLHSGSTV